MKKIKLLTSISLCLLSWNLFSQISGTVFRDFNGNGVKETDEPLVSGIIVNAYDNIGALCGTATSAGATAPNYTLTGCSGNIRVEFVLPNANNCIDANIDFSSTSGSIYGSSVQFVTATSTNVNFGINNPDDYNTGPLNTNIYIPTSSWGDPTGGGTSATFSWYSGYPYTYTGNNPLGSNPPTNVASGEIMGVTWGNAYSKHSQKLFTSALVKRHVGLGTLGTGGIYMLTPTGATFTVTPFYDLDANGYQTRANGTCGLAYGNGSSFTVDATGQQVTYNGTIDASGSPCGLGVVGTNSTERQLPINIGNFPSYDPAAFDQVGKVGIGDIDFSDDGRYLFVTNLYTQKILRLELNDVANPTGVVSVHIFDLPAIGCNNGILRPWGLDYHRGKLYIGAVCTGENGGSNNNTGAPTDLYAYVLKLDNPLGSGTVSNTPVVTVPLNYRKGDPFGSSQTNINEWYPWTNNTGDMVLNDNNAGLGTYPQPILSDIEFNDRGDLIIDFMDRAGHQFGIQNRKFLTNIATTLVSDVISGDILIAGYNCNTGSYGVENNGSVTSQGTTYNGGTGNTEGIGGGEFFKGDKIPGAGHFETSQGSAAHLSGYNDMVFAVMDPIVTNSGGTVRMSMINGDTISASKYQLYFGSGIAAGYLGKANGLGDIELATPIAPLEIGNRVWADTDGDGIQDADEMGLDGIAVKLFSGATLIATKTTANGGQYYFTTADGVLPNTAYTIRIEAASIPSGKSVTLKDQPTGGVQDLGDNDASLVGGNADISYTTGNPGENNHTLDFGFGAVLTCSSSVTAAAGPCNSANNQYTVTGQVTLTNPPSTGTVTVQIVGGGSQTFTLPQSSPISYSIAGQTADGASHTIDVTISGVSCASSTMYVAPVSCYCTPSCLLNASFFQDVILGFEGNTYSSEGQGNNGSCSLDGPYDMTIGPDGNLYISSSVTNTVLKYDIGTVTCQGTLISAGSGGLNNPRGLTFLPNGDLLVNSHNSGQILRYNGTTGASMGVFSNGSDITPGAASMAPHMNIKVGPDGAVWVADHSNNRVLRFNASTGAFISTFAQLPNGTGVRSFEFVGNIVLISGHNLDEVYSYSYTSGMQLSIFADASEGLDGPTGITYGPDGKVYIGSLNSNKILVFDISGTKVGEITANSPKDIVFKCGECFSSSCMVSATASPGNCNPANNQYTVTGQVTLTNPPSTGTVTVQIVGGGSQTFTLPQSSPISYSIAGQIADGASHTVDVSISGVSCASTINYTAPTSCAGCVCYQHYKATQTAQNNSVKAQFFNSIHESPDVVIDFDVYNNGDNLENIPLGTTGNSVTWTNLQGGTITASNDIASSPPMGTLSSIVSATANTNQGDTSKLTFQVPVDYIGFYILDLDDESKMSEIEVTFTDNKKCTFTIDHNIDNCQCEEFLGIVAPQGLQISSLIFKPNTGSRYGLDSICYGQNVGYTFAITPATCTGVTENNNGKISLTKVSVADKYGVSSGSSYTGPTYSGAILIGVLPVDITTNIPNAGGNYTIRFFNGSNICFKDTTVIIAPVTCSTTCLSSVIASAGLCNPANNQYTVAGQILLTDPPSSGTVTVQIVGGGSQTFTLPQTSPISYSIAGQIADGASHTVDVTISGVSCSSTINYTAPVSCLVIPCPSPNCGTLKSKKVINN